MVDITFACLLTLIVLLFLILLVLIGMIIQMVVVFRRWSRLFFSWNNDLQ